VAECPAKVLKALRQTVAEFMAQPKAVASGVDCVRNIVKIAWFLPSEYYDR
jgi:hypothetical protein